MKNIVEKQLNYFNENDLDNFLNCFHQNIEVYNFNEETPIFIGKKALIDNYEKGFTIDKTYAHLENRIILGNKVIDYLRISKVTSDTIKYTVAIYEVEDFLIKKIWFMQS